MYININKLEYKGDYSKSNSRAYISIKIEINTKYVKNIFFYINYKKCYIKKELNSTKLLSAFSLRAL